MRILALFRGRLAESRGTPSRSRNLIQSLVKRGNEMMVLSGDAPGQLEGVVDAPHVTLGDTPREALARAIERHRPELLYGQANKSIPLLVEAGSGAVVVADLHGDPASEKLEQDWRPLPRRLLSYASHRLEDRRWLPRVDGLTTASEGLARRVAPLGKPTAVVWGGVDPELFTAPPPDLGREVTVGYAGNFRPYQGLGVLLEAMSGLDERYRLLLVGDPTGGEGLARRAATLLGDRLTLLPPVHYGEIPDVLAAADVLVVPRPRSRSGHYGFPSKLPEYLALGRAVVASNVGDQARVVRHDDNGLVVAPGSATELAAALRSLADPDLRRRLGEAGRRAAVDELSWSRVGERLQAFLFGLTRPAAAAP